MRRVVLPEIGTVAAWRSEARSLAEAGVPAEAVLWQVGAGPGDLFADGPEAPPGPARKMTLSRQAIAGLEAAMCHKDPERFARGYALLLRLIDGAVRWGDRSDLPMRRILDMEKAVRRDIHKMHAFVRFREVGDADAPRRRFAAWFEPEHPIVEAATPFFARRFGDMDWVIATPGLTARFVDGALTFHNDDAESRPPPDATEDLWRTYYASIFNPARLMVGAMKSEMPMKYWRNLPEAEIIPDLIRGAEARVAEMREAAPSEPPARRAAVAREMTRKQEGPAMPETLDELARAAGDCTRCPLHAPATQVVFGEGPAEAGMMFVGEQPGDQEDLRGRPFVGPAGQIFDEELAAAGIDRGAVYVTNAVKHFKFNVRGKRRIHQRPGTGEIEACRWWLDRERALVRPKLLVALGATACEALTGTGKGILKRRGAVEEAADGTPVFITVHPSYILRLPDRSLQATERARFRDDLTAAQGTLDNLAA